MTDLKTNVKKRELKRELNRIRGEGEATMITSSHKNDVRHLLQMKEVREFYHTLQLSLRKGFASPELEVPDVVQDRLKELLSLYSGLYDEVQVVPVEADGRVFVGVGEGEAKWDEVTTSLEELESSIDLMEMHNIRVGGYTSIPNSVLDDNMVNMVVYLEKLLVKSLASGLDEGILNGKGDYEELFEPIGALKELPSSNLVTVSSDNPAEEVLKHIGLIGIGDKDDVGEVVAVMKRKTYYKSFLATSNQSLPYPNLNGLRVKFSAAVEDDAVILGDFKEYILSERNGISIERSSEQFFLGEQTVFRVVGRYDGKPHLTDAFVKVIIG